MKLPTLFSGHIGKGLPTFQYLAAFTGMLNIMCSGMHYGWSSPTLPKLLQKDSVVPMTNDQSSWIVVMFLLGTFLGADFSAIFLDRVGRKTVILFTSVPYLVSWMLIAFGRSAYGLMAGRFIAGIGDGLIYCAFPMYLGEIADARIRGFLGSSISVMSISGMLFMNIFGSYLSISAAAMVASSVPVLLLLTFSFMPESPYYLIMKKDVEKARRNLMILRGLNNVDDELNRLIKTVDEQNGDGRRWLDLITVKSNRKALFIVMGARAAQQLTGTTAITFYAQTIFREAGDSISPSAASILYFTMHTILVGFSSVIVDKAGRRPLMIISIIGAGLSLLILGCFFYVQNATNVDTTRLSFIPIVTLITFIFTFSVGMQPIPILLIGEFFPTNVKAIALTVCSNYFVVITTIVSKFFQFTKDAYGLHVPFFVFTSSCALGLLFIIFFVPETKGKTLEEIQEELKGQSVPETSTPETYKQIEYI
ncbi:hypothetical protein RN001_015334 [Aquatica leii]|uniref:Major facilitator superfamily (MFS) profile domain-containing protein n=1 Tax=Aquatica leii TaxID=1421715 RepID=A0AAN7PZ98_9COLE|nr:hypothetical protein RN001_015334 [Aquatica leii]